MAAWCLDVNSLSTSLFAELKPLYANSVWITKNNVKANIWKLYMTLEANKKFMENLSLQLCKLPVDTCAQRYWSEGGHNKAKKR